MDTNQVSTLPIICFSSLKNKPCSSGDKCTYYHENIKCKYCMYKAFYPRLYVEPCRDHPSDLPRFNFLLPASFVPPRK
jgi:hypothetical protein